MASRPPRKLTKQFVESFLLPDKGYVAVRDTKTPGLVVRFSKRYRTYYAERKVRGKTVRAYLGRHGTVTLEQARRKTQSEYGKMSEGIDVTAERRKREKEAQEQAKADTVKSTTLAQAYEDLLRTRTLADNTRKSYDQAMRGNLADWLDLPVTSISEDMVARRYAKLSEDTTTLANLTMRTLKAVLNFAIDKYTLPNGEYLLNRNPVKILSTTKAWKKVAPRTNHIKPHELPAWFDAVEQEDNHTARDYLRFVLLTGLRRENAASLTWEQVDFEDRSFTVTPKAHDELTLPLSDYLLGMLRERHERTASPFVFPGKGRKGYLQEPRKALERIAKHTGIKTTVHDLRRSYSQYGVAARVPHEQLKQLLAHSTNDVTLVHYAQHNVENLREPAQRITDYVLAQAKAREASNVVPLKAAG